jgi:hypothetical protein
METYLVFFGNSQGFLKYFYNSSEFIQDFDSVIKDFNLLESRVFTVDSVDNKEILSRYSFVANQGKQYSLLKLYSFAQAYNIPRIEGCIFGVGIISDSLVSLSSKNLNLLKVAKDNFSKLSLNGLKFNKSDFLEDSTKIWKAIVHNESGNLIASIDLEPSQFKNQENPVAFNITNLFQEPAALSLQSKDFDAVYFSEDLEHLKRAQQKSGVDNFPIYVKDNGRYILYKEIAKENKKPVAEHRKQDTENRDPKQNEENFLDAIQKEAQLIKIELKETKKQSLIKSQIILLTIGILLLIFVVAFIWINSLQKKLTAQSQILQELYESSTVKQGSTSGTNQVSFWSNLPANTGFYDTMSLFAKDLKYIAEFNPKKSFKDSAILIGKFKNLNRRSLFLAIQDLEVFGKKYAESLQYIRDSFPSGKVQPTKKNQ